MNMESKRMDTDDDLILKTGSATKEANEKRKTEEQNKELFDPVIYGKDPINDERLMKNIKLRKIADILANQRSTENKSEDEQMNFCVEDCLSTTDIQIAVEKIGKLTFPISNDIVEKLKAVSVKAKFGLGEKTVLDENFRDTHVIDLNKIDVAINEDSLSRILDKMHSSMDLPVETKLKAHKYNLLIYSPGQFFNRHRDSEKISNMIATLVVVLPSPHIGGTLIVEHSNKKYKFYTENLNETNAKCICFYSDCWHEIKKIKAGYRIALIYNVALEGDNPRANLVDEDLKNAVNNYFNDESERCLKFIFLFNHDYSQHSLKWQLLKGEDQEVALKFKEVAKSLNLTIHLVLVDIHQSWNCGDDSHHSTSNMELIESDHTLVFWVDENNAVLSYKDCHPHNSEICFTKETFYKSFKYLDKNVDGPTGNEGCTSDYWYKRAGIVMWRTKNSEKISFDLNFSEAIKRLFDLLKAPKNVDEVRRILDLSVESFPNNIEVYREKFKNFVDVALCVKNDKIAQKTLFYYCGDQIVVKNIPQIVALQQEYGAEFCLKLFEKWLSVKKVSPPLRPFATEFLKAGGDKSLIEIIIDLTIKTLCYGSTNPDYHVDFLQVCAEIDNTGLQEAYIKNLLSKRVLSKKQLGNLLQNLLNTVPDNYERYEPFRLALITDLQADITKRQSQGYWYINQTMSYCRCDVCDSVNNFLKSNKEYLRISGNNVRHINSKLNYFKKVIVSVEGKAKKAETIVKKQKCVFEMANEEIQELSDIIQQYRGSFLKRKCNDSLEIKEEKKLKK